MLTAIALIIGLCGQPGPKPAVADAPKAVITDDAGKPFPASVEGVRVLYFHADKASRDPGNEVFWQVWPKTYQKNAKKFPSGVGLMFVVPVADDSVTLEVQQIVAKTVGKDAQSNLATIMVKVNGGPRPPPVPPDPTPDPTPVPPVPIPADGIKVLIVEETADRAKLPESQLSILFDKRVRGYMDAKCPVDPAMKKPAWAIWDANVATNDVPKFWQDAMSRPRIATPWIAIFNAKTAVPLFEGPLPATIDATLKLLKKYGGE